MKLIDFPIEKINGLLKDHTFIIQNPYPYLGGYDMTISVKIKLTGVKDMIVIGDWKEVIEYTLYLENTNNESLSMFLNFQFDALRTNDYYISSSDTYFYQLTTQVSQYLQGFLKYFSIDNSVFCSRIVNNIPEVQSKNIAESLITEGKYDGIVRQLVKDVVSTIKYQKSGKFNLPEDINGKDVYSFPQLKSKFNIELISDLSEDIESVDVDGAYYPDEEIIEVSILINPKLDDKILEELHFELNELIRHELEHVIQFERGDEIPEKEPKKPIKYYTQPHELQAQIAGFKRKAQKQRKPLKDVIRTWFEKNQSKHRLSSKNIEVMINKIIELA